MHARLPLAAVVATAALGATAAPALAPRAVVTGPPAHVLLTGTVVAHDALTVRARSAATLRPLARPPLRLGLFSYLVPSPGGQLVAVGDTRDGAPGTMRFLDVRRWSVGPPLRLGL